MNQHDDARHRIVCCGHVCLDVIPRLGAGGLPGPGELVQVGPADIAAGGSVSNTGLALHRLGLPVRPVGRVGDDPFGREVRRFYETQGPGLADHLQVVPGEATSYTVVISPPGEDRRFLHCPGVNDTFTDAHVPDAALDDARLLHVGYPPLMRAMCDGGGEPLVRLLARARGRGLLTSLDMAGVDPSSWAGRVDWPALLGRVLPWVDVFLPSRDELAAMLGDDAMPAAVLAMGVKCLVVKDGERGLRVDTSDAAGVLGNGWSDRSLRAGTYIVDTVGTTGAGDVTIAGFLAGLVHGEPPERAADLACAAGAFCVQGPDAVGNVPDLATLRAFIEQHPPRRSG